MTISRYPLILFILFLSCLYSNTINSKNLRGYTDNVEIDGLPYAAKAIQDHQGYLWFANGSGLHRYDGKQLKSFSQYEDGLSYNNTRSLYIDDNDVLWIGTHQGLNRYDPQTQTITHVFDHKWPDSKQLNITAIKADKQQNLWLSTSKNHIVHVNTNTNVFTQIPIKSNTLANGQAKHIRDLTIDNQGYIWIGTNNGLYKLEFNNKKLINSKLYSKENSGFNENLIVRVFVDNNQNLWVGTNKTLYYYHRQSDTISSSQLTQNTDHPLIKQEIQDIEQDQQGNLWVGTWGGGIHIITYEQQQIIEQQQGFNNTMTLILDSFIYQQSASDDIQSNLIIELFADYQGAMWIIAPDGIKKVITSKLKVNHFNFVENFNRNQTKLPQTPIQQNISLPHKYTYGLYKDSKGYLWIAGFNGLARYHKTNRSLQYFYYQKGDINSLPSNEITTVFEDNQQNVWIGTKLGLASFNPQQSNFTRIPIYDIDVDKLDHKDINNVIDYGVQAISQDNNGSLWVIINTYLIKYDISSKQFEKFLLVQPNTPNVSARRAYTIEYDNQDTIWLGHFGSGLGKFNINTNNYTYYDADAGAPGSQVKDLYIEDENKVWMVSHKGLTFYDGNNFEHYLDTSDRATNFNSIEKDDGGQFWIGTNLGLKTFNPKTKHFKTFHTEHGLQNRGIYIPKASLKDSDGSLYFAGTDGIDHFNPQDLTFTPPTLKVSITDFLLANTSVKIANTQTPTPKDKQFSLPKAIEYLDELNLNHQQNMFSFEFNAFNYINPKNNRYQYRLKGFDDDWIETDNNNLRAAFTNIPAGNYQFEVKATTANNPWSATKTLKVTILPPWWQTNLAYFIYLFITIGSLWAIYKWRTQKIVAASRALEQQVKERTKTISELMTQKDQMFANISHEFRTPLTLIINPAEQLISNVQLDQRLVNKNADGIKRNAERLLRMVEQLLELAKVGSNTEAPNMQLYSVKQTIDYLIACFDSLFASKNLNVNINDYEDVLLNLKPDSLEIILTNLISNAIKYSNLGGSIYIEVNQESAVNTQNQQLVIKIKDKGIGIAPENHDKIFERFGRVTSLPANIGSNTQSSIRSTTQASTGIGLALVKELVQINDGQIEIDSELNKGSCFTITLPIRTSNSKNNNQQNQVISEVSDNTKHVTALEICNLSETQNKAPSILETQTNEEETTNQDKPLIVVIDDNHELLELIHSVISPKFEVKLANNGRQGVELATEHLPDLVISDLMMPIMDGFEVLQALKSNPLTTHIPVVMLTAKGDSQSRIEGWNRQADEYLAKPFNTKELIARINNILNIRKIISNRFAQQFAQQVNRPITQPVADIENTTEFSVETDDNQEQLDQIAEQFSSRIKSILEQHYQDEQLSVETIAKQMTMSQRQLVRKTKSLLSMTPNECIRTYRLQKAAEHVLAGMAPSAIAFEVGFASHSYFAACFKAQFGCTPSQYKQQNLS